MIPIPDPLMDDDLRTRTALAVPNDPLVGAVLTALERSALPGPDVVAEAINASELWPPVGNWLVVRMPP